MKKNTQLISLFIVDFLFTINVRDTKSGDIGLRSKSKRNYTSFQRVWKDYEAFEGREITFKELDKRTVERFKMWLLEIRKFALNTAGRHFGTLKTLVNEAKKVILRFISTLGILKDFQNLKTRKLLTPYL